MSIADSIKNYLRDVKDFPKPGIIFKDITPLLSNPPARRLVVTDIANQFKGQSIDAIAGVEARGFIFGMLIAQELNIPFIPIRKAGKLPYHKVEEHYELEYGHASIEMHSDSISKGQRVVIHDDLLATGGTATAAGRLVQRLEGVVAGYSFIINLSFLPGERLLTERFGVNPHYLISY